MMWYIRELIINRKQSIHIRKSVRSRTQNTYIFIHTLLTSARKYDSNCPDESCKLLPTWANGELS